jgi:sterol desaturase/sphingolipid hydroxylase (fatty acid hydroxylase superfamily)
MDAKTEITSNDLYEASLKPERSFIRTLLSMSWFVLALSALVAFCWAEPFSGWLFAKLISAGVAPWIINYIALPLVVAIRGVLLVESVGYGYHRFFQHLGWLTRKAQYIRRNQKFHWIHHMVIYPLGRFYKRPGEYKNSEKGFSWSWVAPALVVAGLFALTHGLTLTTVVFIASFGLYAKFVVDTTHSRFHQSEHPWINKPYFVWLEEIHLLHHWDQRYNFTIVHPLMDMLFGTYKAPKKHREELRLCAEDKKLTVSDLINWRYVLLEATPAEYAAFVSSAERNPRQLRKATMVMEVYKDRLAAHPDDAEAKLLHDRCIDLMRVCPKKPTP